MKKSEKLYIVVRWSILSCTILLGLLCVITFVRHFQNLETTEITSFEEDETIGRLQNFQI